MGAPSSTGTHNPQLLKGAALLTTIKWKMVALTALAQYLAFLFTFHNRAELYDSLHEYKVHIIIGLTAVFLAAGNIINNFYDAERDLVNRPAKARFMHLISPAFTLRLYFALNSIGLVIAYMTSWRIGIFFTLLAFALWFYSHKLSRMIFVRELAASILSVTAFFSLLLYFRMITPLILVYGFSLFMVLFARELHKAIRSIKGDVLYGYRSIATAAGIQASVRLYQSLLVISLFADSLMIYFTDRVHLEWALILIILCKAAMITWVTYDVIKKGKLIHRILQLTIALYIAGVVWL